VHQHADLAQAQLVADIEGHGLVGQRYTVLARAVARAEITHREALLGPAQLHVSPRHAGLGHHHVGGRLTAHHVAAAGLQRHHLGAARVQEHQAHPR
jgi:hypothetical protein